VSSPVVAESNTNGRSSVLTITDVFHAPPSEAVPRFHLDSPKAGTVSDTYSIAFDGWVMGKSSPPVRLEVSRPRHLLAQIRVGSVPRPDLPRVFPDIPWAVTNSGFYASIWSMLTRAALQSRRYAAGASSHR
jgi:hypothetical protein